MVYNYYVPADDGGKANMLDNLVAKLPGYQDRLEIKAADLTSARADAAAFRYALAAQQQMQATAQLWTAYKNRLRDGNAATLPAAAAVVAVPPPPAPGLPVPAPEPVAAGIIARFTNLAARIKIHPNYSEEVGRDLGIIGTERVAAPDTWKPVIGVELKAGHPVVQWTRGDADALEIWVNRGDGKDFVFFDVDNRPPCPDNTPLPAPGTSAVWTYRAIYRLNDERVGQWSDQVSISVAR